MRLHDAWRPGGPREGCDEVLRERLWVRSLLAPFQGAMQNGGGPRGSPVVAPPAHVLRASGSEAVSSSPMAEPSGVLVGSEAPITESSDVFAVSKCLIQEPSGLLAFSGDR